MRFVFSLFLVLLLPALHAQDRIAVMPDGGQVRLLEDGTWEAIDLVADDTPKADLRLVELKSIPGACQLGTQLHNQLNTQIRSLVLRYGIHKQGASGPVMFDSVSRGYSYLRPTEAQYQELIVRGMRCRDILFITVDIPPNCHVGEINKYSEDQSACKSLVNVVENPKVKIFKYQDPEEQTEEEEVTEAADDKAMEPMAPKPAKKEEAPVSVEQFLIQ